MNVVVRADASRVIGNGHVMRCLTLARALDRRGVRMTFVCREEAGHLCELLAQSGFDVVRLPSAASSAAPWSDDAELTCDALSAHASRPDYLIVDHYELGIEWERRLRPAAGMIMAIDDLANRPHDCDVLLDQNLVPGRRAFYAANAPPTCTLLLGPQYALLQAEYAALHEQLAPRSGRVRNILVFFSGADSEDLTGDCVRAFRRIGRPDVEMNVVVATGGRAASIAREIEGVANVHLHVNVPTLAPLMACADVAVGASGTASWERCCLGLPALVVSMGENQRAIAESLDRSGIIRWLGHADAVDSTTLERALREVLTHELSPDWSMRCRDLVDGKGTERVVGAMIEKAGVQ